MSTIFVFIIITTTAILSLVTLQLGFLRAEEEMAAAYLDDNTKEELSTIEQCKQLEILSSHPDNLTRSLSPGLKVLSEVGGMAALYNFLLHSTQVQIHFFITVLQQMARADSMTALLSPAIGCSMQSQMETKLASMDLKSPGLKSTVPGSPSSRTFNTSAIPNCQSLAIDPTSYFLFPDTANTAGRQPKRRCRYARPTARQTQSPWQRRASHFCAGARLEHRRARHLGRRQFARPGRGAR